jgi:hypothetical protein
MANRESFTGYLEVAVLDQARGAKTPVNLRGFNQLGMQLGVVLLQRRDLQFQFPLMRLPT